jgi:hypothetical protein
VVGCRCRRCAACTLGIAGPICGRRPVPSDRVGSS